MTIDRVRWTTCAALLALAAGCAPEDGGSGSASDAPFTPVADVPTIMSAILDPAADVYWDAVGWIVDAAGTLEIRPQTLEEWDAVRNAAYVIAESGNLLMMEGRAVDDGDWMGMSRALTEVAQRAIAAAAARDEAAVFEVGGEIYNACTVCHATYAVETLRPGTVTTP